MTIWIHPKEYENMLKLGEKLRKQEAYFMFRSTPAHEELRKQRAINADNRKFAYIRVANTTKLAFVDNVTMKAYKADGYEKTWMEIKDFSFIRWARGMDL